MTSGAPWLRLGRDGPILSVWVQPGARQSGVLGPHGDALKIAVSEKAVDGAANRAVCALLAELLEVARSDVTILRGLRSRRKEVLVSGITGPAVTARLAPFLPA